MPLCFMVCYSSSVNDHLMWREVDESGHRSSVLISVFYNFPFVTGRFSAYYFEEFYWEAIHPTHTKAESYPYVCLDKQWYFYHCRCLFHIYSGTCKYDKSSY